MATSKMHRDEVETSVDLVQRLLESQFPQWAEMPVRLVDSFGTDHDIYRVGDQLSARLPRIEWATAQAAKEAEWLPMLAPYLPLAIPVPQAMGRADQGYPFDWSMCDWLIGNDLTEVKVDLDIAATDLARFVLALRTIDTVDAPSRPVAARGAPLFEFDIAFRRSMVELGDRVNSVAATRSWDESLEASVWATDEVWVHGDLLPGNLLVVDGRLSAVIDFGGLNVGDPACDLLAAWNVFEGDSRDGYRQELAVDEDSWLRGRGWALLQAVMALPYYWDTNPGMVRQASHAVQQVLAD